MRLCLIRGEGLGGVACVWEGGMSLAVPPNHLN